MLKHLLTVPGSILTDLEDGELAFSLLEELTMDSLGLASIDPANFSVVAPEGLTVPNSVSQESECPVDEDSTGPVLEDLTSSPILDSPTTYGPESDMTANADN